MRKFKAWSLLFIMALCVMFFSGCGGTYTEDKENSNTTTEENNTTDEQNTTSDDITTSSDVSTTIAEILTGTWQFDNSGYYKGVGTYESKDVKRDILVWNVKNFNMSFSNINLNGTSPDLRGTAKVFYSYECEALNDDANRESLGTVNIKSGTAKTMTLSQTAPQQWLFESISAASSNVNRIMLTLIDSGQTRLQWNASAYIPGLEDYCECEITCDFIKTSSTPTNTDSDSTSTTSSDIDIVSALKGTWLLNSEGTATATNTSTGEALNLTTSTGTKIAFSNVSTDINSALVYFLHSWQALNSSSVLVGTFDIRSYTANNSADKFQNMTLVHVEDNTWRLESHAGTSNNVSITLTLNSATEMSTKWDGWSYIPSLGGNYHYVVEASYKKSTNAIISEDIPFPDAIASGDTTMTSDNAAIANSLTGTWQFDDVSGIITESATYNASGTKHSLTLLNATGLQFSLANMKLNGTSPDLTGTANVYYSHECLAYEGANSFGTVSIIENNTMAISQIAADKWSISSGDTNVILTFPYESERQMDLQLSGSAYVPGLETSCNYKVTCNIVVKTSDTPSNSDSTSGDTGDSTSETSSDIDIKSLLTGTWLLNSESTATATNSTTGETLNLETSTGTKIAFNNVASNNTDVYYLHNWQAIDASSILAGVFDTRSYTIETSDDKAQNMTLVKISDDQWRIESKPGSSSNVNIILTIKSETEIYTQWNGWAYVPSLQGTYHYVIEATYIKTSNSYSEDDIPFPDISSNTPSDTEDTLSAYDRIIKDILTGTWLLHTEGTATATNITTGTALNLTTSIGSKISFKQVGIDDYETGSVDVYYLHNWLAFNDSSILAGNFDVRSYTVDNSADKTQEMNIVRVAENEWRIGSMAGSSSNVNISITVNSETEISTQWDGLAYIPTLKGYYHYVIEADYRKSSTQYSDDGDLAFPESTSNDINTDEKTIDEILKGTWLLHTGDSATATEITTGSALTLNSSYGNKIAFKDFNINANNTGSADVYYLHNWLAFDGDIMAGSFDVRSYTSENSADKTQEMTIVKISDTQWRLDANYPNPVSLVITVVSGTEITTEWNGYANIPSLNGYYHYVIQASYRKSSNTAIIDEASEFGEKSVTDVLTGTWKLHTEGDEATATNTNTGLEDVLNLKLGTNTEITFSEITLSGDIANKIYEAKVNYYYSWLAFNSLDESLRGTFTDTRNETMRLIQRTENEWRVESLNGGNDSMNIIITINTPTEIATHWEGIAPFEDTNYHYVFECTFSKQ